MPGADHNMRERIERGWWRVGFEDARAGRPIGGPDDWSVQQSAAMGLDTRGAYTRGYGEGATMERACPGLPGDPPGPCGSPADAGDRYCSDCRARFDAESAQPHDGGAGALEHVDVARMPCGCPIDAGCDGWHEPAVGGSC